MNQTLATTKDPKVGPATLPPTREMARQRTVELAQIAGREAHQIRQSDYEQAKRELTGEITSGGQQAVFDKKSK